MEKSVAVFAIINFSVIGLSHVLQHQSWRDFFQLLHAQGRAGAFANGFLTLLTGSFIVSFHNVWSGVPILLTLIGWAYLAKSLAIFVFPDWNVRSMAAVKTASPVKFKAAGFGLLTIATILSACIAGGQY